MKISNIKCDFSNVKVNDKVYSIRYGSGMVCDVFKGLFVIDFEDFSKSFTFNGSEAEYQDKYPSLFWSEPELTKLPIPKPKEYITVDGFIPVWQKECVCGMCGCTDALVFDIKKETAESLSIRMRDKDWNIKSHIIINFKDFTFLSNMLHEMKNRVITDRCINLSGKIPL